MSKSLNIWSIEPWNCANVSSKNAFTLLLDNVFNGECTSYQTQAELASIHKISANNKAMNHLTENSGFKFYSSQSSRLKHIQLALVLREPIGILLVVTDLCKPLQKKVKKKTKQLPACT